MRGEKIMRIFPKKEKETITLPADKKYVICHKKEKVITDEECDHYEHNKKCDETGDIQHRTHRKSSYAGYRYTGGGPSGSVLNQCKYCLKNQELETFVIPVEARKFFQEG